jgi:hypothetical protein
MAGAKANGSKLMALGVGILAIVCLNALRILLMTPSEEAYHFWHEGSGATIFSCLTFGAIAVPRIISLRPKLMERLGYGVILVIAVALAGGIWTRYLFYVPSVLAVSSVEFHPP